jgi:hypothetical protein
VPLFHQGVDEEERRRQQPVEPDQDGQTRPTLCRT